MSPTDVAVLRAKACDVVAALGSVLDSLKITDEVISNPCDAYASCLLVAQHLDEAAGMAETLAEHAHELALALDKQQLATKHRAENLERLQSSEQVIFGAEAKEGVS